MTGKVVKKQTTCEKASHRSALLLSEKQQHLKEVMNGNGQLKFQRGESEGVKEFKEEKRR